MQEWSKLFFFCEKSTVIVYTKGQSNEVFKMDREILTKQMKALADLKRLTIVKMVSKQEMCGNEILADFDITQPTLSHDMKILTEAGIIQSKRVGKNVYYSVHKKTLQTIIEELNSYL